MSTGASGADDSSADASSADASGAAFAPPCLPSFLLRRRSRLSVRLCSRLPRLLCLKLFAGCLLGLEFVFVRFCRTRRVCDLLSNSLDILPLDNFMDASLSNIVDTYFFVCTNCSMSNNTFSAVKSGRAGECAKNCALTIQSRTYDVSLRWRKNEYGGIIQMNYTTNHNNEFTFAGKAYKGTGTVIIDFLNHAGVKINNIEPEAVVHIEFMDTNSDIVRVLVPFVVADNQGSFPITKGSDLIHAIVDQLKTYQPSEGDPSTQLSNVNVNDFIPEEANYYYAVSNNGDKYVILQKIQAFKTEDKNTMFNDLFKLGDSYKYASRGGTNLDISKYYTSDQFIKISDVYRDDSKEGFTGMGKSGNTQRLMPPPAQSLAQAKSHQTQEGFTSGEKDSGEIYIDCRPVGADETKTPVKHEKTGMISKKEEETMIMIIGLLVGIIMFSLILYGLNWGISKFG